MSRTGIGFASGSNAKLDVRNSISGFDSFRWASSSDSHFAEWVKSPCLKSRASPSKVKGFQASQLLQERSVRDSTVMQVQPDEVSLGVEFIALAIPPVGNLASPQRVQRAAELFFQPLDLIGLFRRT